MKCMSYNIGIFSARLKKEARHAFIPIRYNTSLLEDSHS
jgi:hypothetical protein